MVGGLKESWSVLLDSSHHAAVIMPAVSCSQLSGAPPCPSASADRRLRPPARSAHSKMMPRGVMEQMKGGLIG